MKRYITKYLWLFFILLFSNGCDNLLEEELYSQLGAANYLQTEEGLNTVLSGSYHFVNPGPQYYMYKLMTSTITSGIGWGLGGGFEKNFEVYVENFTWLSTFGHINEAWNIYFQGIRNTNIVIDQLDNNETFSPEFSEQKQAEAKALRGYFYYQLYKYFGSVPVFTSSNPESLYQAGASEEEIKNRIEMDLREAANDLPIEQEQFGRITKGGALGMLCKFYLNTKQWQQCINTASEIISLGKYQLVSDYKDIYSHSNEGHNEILWVVPQLSAPREESTNIVAIMSPPDYPLPPGQSTYAARNYVYDSFVNSFNDEDIRKDLIELNYVNKNGVEITGYGEDKSLWWKYPIDPNGVGDQNGIDYIAVRYADILLSKAESLNEINGPNQESIDLINQIRTRAKIENIQLSDFASKETLRNHILNERLWEFYLEGFEREDQIRHGVFISRAKERGLNATDNHRLFPIPQSEIDANPEIVQNPGY